MRHATATRMTRKHLDMVMVGAALVLTAAIALLVGLAFSLRPAAPAEAPATPLTSNRFFQDEIAGAAAAQQQGVLGYIQAHEEVQVGQAAADDPAQQGVLGYIQAHEEVQVGQAAANDPVQQGVLGYIQAHAVARPAPAGNRFFADERAGAAQAPVWVEMPASLEPATPLSGPR